MQQEVEVVKYFTSKIDALHFMQFLNVNRILLDSTGSEYKVVYAALRSTVDGEVVPKEEETSIITS